MGQTLIVDSSCQNEINDLRMQEYAKASGFAVDLTTLKWKKSDDESYVLALMEDGKIISTMRGEVIMDKKLLEQKLECPWFFSLELKFPVLLLSRAATTSSYRSAGLNLLLRSWFLKFALEKEIPFVMGTFVAGSPREKTLREMGYHFFENQLGWQQSTYRSLRPVQVVALNMETEGLSALQYCEEKLTTEREKFPFTMAYPNLKTVSTL